MPQSNEEKMVKHLEDIAYLLGDLNHIRHGEYEPPKGANPDSPRPPHATPDDLSHQLDTVIGLLERQNSLIYNLGRVVCEVNESSSDYWRDLNSR